MTPVKVYTTEWCGSCRRLKSQLTRDGVSFVEVDIERNDDAAAFVMAANNGKALVPTVEMPDGTTFGNPAASVVKAHLDN